jgi:hypothetical protein
MSPPSLKVLILGHPLIVFLVMCGSAYLDWRCYLHAVNGTVFLAVGGTWLVWVALKDFDHRRRYRAWRRDCMTVAGERAKRSAHMRPAALLSIVPIVLILGGIVGHGRQSSQAMILGAGCSAALLAGLVIVRLLWAAGRLLRRDRPKPAGPVSVVIRKPLLAAPSLQDAYRALPAYCQQILKARP